MRLRTLFSAFIVLCLPTLLAAAVSVAEPAPQGVEVDAAGRSARAVTLANDNRILVWDATGAGDVEPSSVFTGGIQLTVLNQHEQLADGALVEWYQPDRTTRDGYEYVHDGRLNIPVPDGLWRLVIMSPVDGFETVRESVMAPGSVTIAPTDTVAVQVSAVLPSGAPLDSGEVYMEPYLGWGLLGETNAAGERSLLLQPRTYAGLIVDRNRFLYLHRRAITVSSATSVVFDAREMPTATVLFRHPAIEELYLLPFLQLAGRSWGPALKIPDGGQLILTADTYDLRFNRFLSQGSDEWSYLLVDAGSPHDILAGSTTTVWAGTTLAAFLTTGTAVYVPAGTVHAVVSPTDTYGSRLRFIHRNGQRVAPHLVCTDPFGRIVFDSDTEYNTEFALPNVSLPSDAPNGTYSLEWSFDTGPWQGILRAQTTFRVEGQTLPTPTRGPTVTPAVTGPWHMWLPVIVKDV